MILIASPSKMIRRRWRNTLADVFPICEVGDKQALKYLLKKFEPNVLFLDHDIGGGRKSALLRELVVANPALRIMVFTTNPTPSEGIAVIKAGAKGYGPKSLSKPLLQKAVRVISRGELWIVRDLVPALVSEMMSSRLFREEARSFGLPGIGKIPSNVFTGLSPREFQIASLIGTGQHNSAISRYLHINEKTVKAHLTTIFRKFGVSSRTQLALAVSKRSASQKYPQYPKPQFPTEASLS